MPPTKKPKSYWRHLQQTNNLLGTPERLTPAQLEVLKAVIEMPGLTSQVLRKEFIWHVTPSFASLEHRLKVLEKRGVVKRITVTKIPTNYPTDIGKATLRSLQPVPMNKWCITCDKSGKRKVPVAQGKRFCQEHVELFAKIRLELSAPKYLRKRYICKSSNCPNPRPKDEELCYICRNQENE